MIIRQALLTDRKALFELAYNFPSPEELDSVIFESTLRQKIEDSNCYIGLAIEDGDLIAYASGSLHSTFYANGPTFWVDEILVVEEFRKKGIGNILMNDILEWSSKKNCKLVSLATNGASEFYKSIGFTDSARYFKKYL